MGENPVMTQNFWRSKCSIEGTQLIRKPYRVGQLKFLCVRICTAVTCKEILLYAYLRRHIKQCKLIDR